MVNYSLEELLKISSKILKVCARNVWLLRELCSRGVIGYLVEDSDGIKYLIKIYESNLMMRKEEEKLKIFNEVNIKACKFLSSGQLSRTVNYIAAYWIQGTRFSLVEDIISQNDKTKIYMEMGNQMALLHKVNREKFLDFIDIEEKEYTIKKLNKQMKLIRSQKPDEIYLLEIAYRWLVDNIWLLDNHIEYKPCFTKENLIVNMNEYKWEVVGVYNINVSQNVVKDVIYTKELLDREGHMFGEAFIEGYSRVDNLLSILEVKRRFNKVLEAIDICSWAKEVKEDYYNEGIKTIEENLYM